MSTDSKIAAVEKAHEDGVLFAHMFEFNRLILHQELPKLLAVMNGNKDGRFKNRFRDVTGCEDGYRGLAVTALKKGLGVPVWTDASHVGLLFDGNAAAHVKPVHVSSTDSFSYVRDDCLRLRKGEPAAFADLAAMQNVPRPADGNMNHAIDMSNGATLSAHITVARTALKEMWDKIEAMGWEAYAALKDDNQGINPLARPGMNEVNIIAHLRGAAGIIVRQYSEYANGDTRFSEALRAAKHTRDVLRKEYDLDLPVFAYDPRAQHQLIALTEEQLAQPAAPQPKVGDEDGIAFLVGKRKGDHKGVIS